MSSLPPRPRLFPLWWERLLTLVILLNCALVFFNLTYVPLRDFWLQGRVQATVKLGPWRKEFPDPPLQILPFSVAPFYDWVKDIEPHRFSVQYLDLVDQVTALAAADPALSAPELDDLLAQLREESREMIATNPFQAANKTGALERLKNRMRRHIFGSDQASATQSFNQFWSRDYLRQNNVQAQLNFFNQRIRPLMETNYFRGFGENGLPIDNFPLLDFPFFLIFLGDFLLRTRCLSRQHPGLNWLEAMFWRWYDAFLIIPFARPLRLIPLTFHLGESGLVNLAPVRNAIVQGLVGIIAGEMTEVIILRILSQGQEVIREGQLRQLLAQRGRQSYIDLNDRNEAVEIVKIVSQVLVERVLPRLEPEVQAFVGYTFNQSFQQLPLYQTLTKLPGFETLNARLQAELLGKSYEQLLQILQVIIRSDPQFDALLEALVSRFLQQLNQELQVQDDLQEIETLLVDWVEEFKVNYVQKLSDTDIDALLDETRLLRQRQSSAP